LANSHSNFSHFIQIPLKTHTKENQERNLKFNLNYLELVVAPTTAKFLNIIALYSLRNTKT